MEAIAKDFILHTSTITISLSYCYYISSKIPKGLYRLISLIPILYLFTILPLHSTYVFTTAITASFTTWLTNFKLIRFAFDLDHSPYHPSYSLLQFITLTSLPIKSKSNYYNSPPNSSKLGFNFNFKFKSQLAFQILIFSILLTVVINHNRDFHPNVLLLLYCGLLFLLIDVFSGLMNVTLVFLTGLELEPSSNHPYLASSLQNFWGRWNLMVTNTLRHTVYKPIRSTLTGHEWAPLVAILASFLVSGLMHELFVYQLSREAPTWEMTWFFIIHGICVVGEMVLKRYLASRGLRVPKFVGWVLTIGFVVGTGMWLFLPPLVRRRIDVKIIEEYLAVVDYIKVNFFIFWSR